MADSMTRDERLRRLGDLLLKGVYLWAEVMDQSEVKTHPGDGAAASPVRFGDRRPAKAERRHGRRVPALDRVDHDDQASAAKPATMNGQVRRA